jgi:hypothetical protein
MATATHVQDIRDIDQLNKATKVRVEEQIEERRHERSGGFKLGAALLGWLTATGLSTILTALLSATGTALIASQLDTGLTGLDITRISMTTGALLVVIAAVAYFAGGYVAGRLARFDGVRQGVGVWLITIAIVLLAALAGVLFGARFNVPQQINLPSLPVDLGSITATSVVTLLLVLGITLATAILGAKLGERYNRKVDQSGL